MALTPGTLLYTALLGLLICGPMADRFGRRPVLLGGLMVFTLGGIASALAPTMEIPILARLLQGAGAAAGRVLAPAIIRDNFSGPRGAQLLSRMMMILMFAAMLTPMIGGMLPCIALAAR